MNATKLGKLLYIWNVPNLRVLFLVRLFSNMAFANSIVALFLQDRGLSFLHMFLLESIISATILVFEIPSGVWADRWGRRRMIVVSMWLLTVSSIIFALAHSFWVFALESALFGSSVAFLSGSDSALVYETLAARADRDRADESFGILDMAPSMGIFIGMATGSFFAEYSLEVPIYVTAVATTVAALISTKLREPAAETTEQTRGETTFEGMRRAWRQLRDNPVLMSYGLFTAVVWLPGLAVHYLFQPLFQRVGMPLFLFGPVIAVGHLTMALASAMAPSLGRWLGINRTLVTAVVLQGLLLLVVPFTATPFLAGLVIVLVLGVDAIRVPLINAESNRLITGSQRAAILSFMGALSSVIGIVVKPFIGSFTDLGVDAGFRFLAGLALAAALIFTWVWRGPGVGAPGDSSLCGSLGSPDRVP